MLQLWYLYANNRFEFVVVAYGPEYENHTFNQHIILPIINMKNATGFCLQNKNIKKINKNILRLISIFIILFTSKPRNALK